MQNSGIATVFPYCTPGFGPRCKIATHWQEYILSLAYIVVAILVAILNLAYIVVAILVAYCTGCCKQFLCKTPRDKVAISSVVIKLHKISTRSPVHFCCNLSVHKLSLTFSNTIFDYAEHTK
jgi:hypothetical protein